VEILKRENRELSTSMLAKLAQINIKNISKYTKVLIEEGAIRERPEKEGKKRTKYYSLELEPKPVSLAGEPEEEINEDESINELECFKKALEFAQNQICADCQPKLEHYIQQLKKRINALLEKQIHSY